MLAGLSPQTRGMLAARSARLRSQSVMATKVVTLCRDTCCDLMVQRLLPRLFARVLVVLSAEPA